MPAPAAPVAPAPDSPALDAALQRVLAPHCGNDTAALRSAALQAAPHDRALLERIVRLCASMQQPDATAGDARSADTTPRVDRSGRARLVVGATAYGLWAGIAADVLFEVDDARGSVVPPLLGVGAGLGLSLLATETGPITRGQAWTIITGLDYGTYSGLLLAGAVDATDDAKDVVGVALASGLVGGTIATVAAQLQPTAGDAEMVRSGGLWGFASAGLLSAIIQPEREQTVLGLMLAGMDGGLLTGALLAPEYSISRDRMLLGDAGALAGAVAGVGIGILVVGTPSDGEGRAVALSSLIGLHTGLALSLYLTREMQEEGGSDENEQASAPRHEPPPALLVRDEAGGWRAGRLSLQPALDGTRRGMRPVGAWMPLLGGYW